MATTLRCPVCKKEVKSDDPNVPFCSDRCRVIDLGNWASDKYFIAGTEQALEEDEDPPETPPESKGW